MNWRRPSRPGVGIEYWKSDSDYVRPGKRNDLKSYLSCLKDMPGRSKIFEIIIDHVKQNYQKEETITLHELGCNAGYNLDHIRESLEKEGYEKILCTGNDSWGDAVQAGNEKFSKIKLEEKSTFEFLSDLASGKRKIEILFSHSHLIHVTNEDLDLIYPAIKNSVSKSFFFEDFELMTDLLKFSDSDNCSEDFLIEVEELNSTKRVGVKIFGDAHIFTYVESLKKEDK